MRSPRELPSVDQLLRKMRASSDLPHDVIKGEIRAALESRRYALRNGEMADERPVEDEVADRLSRLHTASLRRVINATGVVLHTNLGRAPLAHFEPVEGYSNLEYDLAAGRRGKRDAHVAPLLERLLGRSAIVVNNNAGAVYLVLNELAARGEVIVSRGELIEIGDGFRIPEIMSRSGAVLREVGTTNRTRIEDYEQAISDQTRLLLRVHPSNFHMSGFTARPTLDELVRLAGARSLPVFEDLGSGCLVDLRAYGISEPLVQASLTAGINVVSFSCDKLLGGPQAAIIAGDAELIARIRRNPLYRAFRVDKLILQSLQVTLLHLLKQDWGRLPALRMIMTPLAQLRARAERIASRIGDAPHRLRQAQSAVGGGSTPDQALPSWVLELHTGNAAELEKRLRAAPTPVVARIEQDRVIIDLRTVSDDEEDALGESLCFALGR